MAPTARAADDAAHGPVPDTFTGGLIGAVLAAPGGALLTASRFPAPGIPGRNPPGLEGGWWPIPCAGVGLRLVYVHGRRAGGRGLR